MDNNTDGIWKDYKNNKSCDTIDEWQNYLSTTSNLTHIGVTSCSMCGAEGQEVHHTGTVSVEKQSSPPAICEKCKVQVREGDNDG